MPTRPSLQQQAVSIITSHLPALKRLIILFAALIAASASGRHGPAARRPHPPAPLVGICIIIILFQQGPGAEGLCLGDDLAAGLSDTIIRRHPPYTITISGGAKRCDSGMGHHRQSRSRGDRHDLYAAKAAECFLFPRRAVAPAPDSRQPQVLQLAHPHDPPELQHRRRQGICPGQAQKASSQAMSTRGCNSAPTSTISTPKDHIPLSR